jgi:flagellar FliL protein
LKANPKLKAEPKAEAAAPANSKKLVLILGLVAVLAAAGGGGAWFMLKDGGEHEAPAKQKKSSPKAGPPVYVTIEPFTVNLQPENGEQYLQLAFTLQVSGLEEVEVIKNNMPKVRSRLLLLLSSKKASEINTPEGKQQLSAEIMEQVRAPFEERGAQQDVTEVLFTSFIIQ